MRLGISLTSGHMVKDPREGARWMIERAAAAHRADLDSLFVGDHHSTPTPYYQNVPMMGRLLAEWGDKPAGCLFLLPLWNPVLVAEQVGTLAAIASGRFIFQCGLGDGQPQFAAMGAEIKQRPSAFEESLGIIQRLLRGRDGERRAPLRLRERGGGAAAGRDRRVLDRRHRAVPPSTARRASATASWPRRP